MRDIIENFLKTDDRAIIPLQIFPIDVYRGILRDFGYEIFSQETDGGSVDFWIDFNEIGELYPSLQLTGSLVYGGYSLSKI